ncbi:hypothetical protein [Streptomyces sp. FH025]|uniref:hypothetical protein n=1 Tax=Streptomyces sp. FH025 TaxID=2815937 RepID=UPI001A9FFED1|nr:hypothetical protein [Streptomyces sp. FH025]MBO1420156.1 hypothetical protein [Streptomyces sp. FH025]
MIAVVIRRGVRLGVRIGAAPAGLAASLWLGVAVAQLLVKPHVLPGFSRLAVVVGGSLGVGVLAGAITGAALALSPEWLAGRASLRGPLAGIVAGTTYLGETVVVAVASDGGYGPMLLALLSTLVVSVVAAVHSGDILRREHSQKVSMLTHHPGHRQQEPSGRRLSSGVEVPEGRHHPVDQPTE